MPTSSTKTIPLEPYAFHPKNVSFAHLLAPSVQLLHHQAYLSTLSTLSSQTGWPENWSSWGPFWGTRVKKRTYQTSLQATSFTYFPNKLTIHFFLLISSMLLLSDCLQVKLNARLWQCDVYRGTLHLHLYLTGVVDRFQLLFLERITAQTSPCIRQSTHRLPCLQFPWLQVPSCLLNIMSCSFTFISRPTNSNATLSATLYIHLEAFWRFVQWSFNKLVVFL